MTDAKVSVFAEDESQPQADFPAGPANSPAQDADSSSTSGHLGHGPQHLGHTRITGTGHHRSTGESYIHRTSPNRPANIIPAQNGAKAATPTGG